VPICRNPTGNRLPPRSARMSKLGVEAELYP
jgi:hypothetical protein